MVPAAVLDAGSWLQVYVPGEHSCPEREARQAREREEAAAKEKAWRENPPEARIAAVFERSRLPRDAPVGLRQVRIAEVDRRYVEVVAAHRRRWLAGETPEKGLWLHGPTNSRKTMLVSALLFDIGHRTPRRALFWNVADLMDHIRLDARGKKNEYDPEALNAAEVLCLDDLGTVKVTETAWERLFHIIEAARSGWGSRRRKQVLYVTSNEAPETLFAQLAPPGDADGGERIVRRLLQITDAEPPVEALP